MAHAPAHQRLFATAPFDVRHPFLLHGTLVLLCWCTYGFDRVDVVWRLIRNSGDARVLEHIGFGLAAFCIGIGVWLGAWRGGHRANLELSDPRVIRRRSVGEIFHAIGIASLLPAAGALMLVAGEAIRSALYARWSLRHADSGGLARTVTLSLRASQFLRRHIAGICAFLSMLVFSITLRDRLADGLFAATALVFVVTRFIDVP